MMKAPLLLLLIFCSVYSSFAQGTNKHAVAQHVTNTPVIDGKLDDPEWQQAVPITDFVQYLPMYNKPPTFQTEVRILYSNEGIYIGATLYDPHPDSILRQLGNRDEDNINADWFSIAFDTYNSQRDAYTFIVSAAGVQADNRAADLSFNAVWRSAVVINKSGWVAEMMIPYSAIRFPNIKTQTWGMQIIRSIRRFREKDSWALVENGAANSMVFWGKLNGIENISPPLRLSLTPYTSVSLENYPYNIKGKDNTSYSFSGGLDLKYGINESFTLDMSLLPDFSQVQSDNQIKNLSAFETTYSEQRTFFQEAVDLFEKGDLFYSRRIGRIPLNYFQVNDELKVGEKITKNPYQAKLLNATKFSGRNKHGFAIGILNAITDNTYAVIEDSTGNHRNYLTDPRSNYNIVVVDQTLKNNSSFYLINTNVTRDKLYPNANVTGAGITLNDKAIAYRLIASGAVSQLITKNSNASQNSNSIGYKYNLAAGKVSGQFQYQFGRAVMDNYFSANDMGITYYNNFERNNGQLAYYIYEPVGILRELTSSFNLEHELNYCTRKITNLSSSVNVFGTFLNYLSWWVNADAVLYKGYDYYEPRTAGRYYIKPTYQNLHMGISSDYRKPFALDMSVETGRSETENWRLYETTISPIIRVNNHLGFTYSCSLIMMTHDLGYADKTSSDIFFGRRDIREIENTFSARYMFKNNLSLNLRGRHYWSKGDYDKFYILQNDGKLSETGTYAGNADYNFNAFNIDLVFSWEFSPGSRLEMIWKNSVLSEDQGGSVSYWENFKQTTHEPQLNNFTLKLLYYIDYQSLKRYF